MYCILGKEEILENVLNEERLKILRRITANPRGVTTEELSELTDASKTTVHRAIEALEECGAVEKGKPTRSGDRGPHTYRYKPTYKLFAARPPKQREKYIEETRDGSIIKFPQVMELESGSSRAYRDRVKNHFPETEFTSTQQENLADLLMGYFWPILVEMERGREHKPLDWMKEDWKEFIETPISAMTVFLWAMYHSQLKESLEDYQESLQDFLASDRVQELAEADFLGPNPRVNQSAIYKKDEKSELQSIKRAYIALEENIRVEYSIILNLPRKEIWVIARNENRLEKLLKESADKIWKLEEAKVEIGNRTFEVFFGDPKLPTKIVQKLEEILPEKEQRKVETHIYGQELSPDTEFRDKTQLDLAKGIKKESYDVALDFYPGKPSENEPPGFTIILPNQPSNGMEEEIGEELEIESVQASVISANSVLENRMRENLELALGSSEDADGIWESIPEESRIITQDATNPKIKEKFRRKIKNSEKEFGVIVDPSHRSVFVVVKKGKEEIEDFKHPSVEMFLIE